MNKLIRVHSRGFTLIELLVVIAIIGLLSSVIFAALSTARVKARDAKRSADLYQIATALEASYDANGSYVNGGEVEFCDASNSLGNPSNCVGRTPAQIGTYWDSTSDTLRTLVTGGYMARLPVDPINNGTYFYNIEYFNANEVASGKPSQGFFLCARFESTGLSSCLVRGEQNIVNTVQSYIAGALGN